MINLSFRQPNGQFVSHTLLLGGATMRIASIVAYVCIERLVTIGFNKAVKELERRNQLVQTNQTTKGNDNV